MKVSHATKGLRVLVELDEEETKNLQNEYEKLDSYKFPIIDDLVAQLVDLAPEN
jgi:hypothetical protein